MLTGRPNSARIKATIREGQMVASSDTLFSVGMEAMHRGGLGLSSGPEFLLKTAHRCFEVLLKHPDWQSPGKQVQLRLKIVDSLVPSILENSAMIETHLLKAVWTSLCTTCTEVSDAVPLDESL